MVSDWESCCELEYIHKRAQMLADIRAYFANQDVLEVETPILGQGIGTDINLEFFSTSYSFPPGGQTLFMQTSPEFSMKRLLASGSGSIFQICKAFRNGETGRLHNPEFTLLEWYRVNYNLPELMTDIDNLLQGLFSPALSLQETQRSSYQEVFFQYTGLDALHFSQQQYIASARANKLFEAETLCGFDHALWLDFLFSHLVQPKLGKQALTMIFDYPACLPSLARLNPKDTRISERVEIFLEGVELGNGYHELIDYQEQLARFSAEAKERERRGLPKVAMDMRFLEALKHDMPDCSGIAIGLDRLLMLITGNHSLKNILSFPVARA